MPLSDIRVESLFYKVFVYPKSNYLLFEDLLELALQDQFRE
ncbi:hypothetical protein VDG1235_1364 [Verrucomicrobiia bacterium DG1235]|nr:hypothetical protein VDG1235_1364 [Verrucomicrobiae bacterium DG1235]